MSRWKPNRVQIRRTAQVKGLELVIPTAERVRDVAKRIVHKKSGKLSRSIRMKRRMTADWVRAQVGSDLTYAAAQHDGATRHDITPVRARWLKFYWVRVGRTVYAKRVNHPGNEGTGYLMRPLERIATRRGFIVVRNFVVRSDNPFL